LVDDDPSLALDAVGPSTSTVQANPTDTLSQDRYRAALAGIDNLLTLITILER
jgi:hypothetical protein